MKVLWFSNILLNDDLRSSGTWLLSMAEGLLMNRDIELFNITQGQTKFTLRKNYKGIEQWYLPLSKKIGLPNQTTINEIKSIVDFVKPDIVHIWGTESYWGLLAAQKIFKVPVLLDMQGVLSEIVKVYYGGLNIKEIIKCTGLKEILLPNRLLFFKNNKYRKQLNYEREIIKNIKFISFQSQWVKAFVEKETNNCNLFNSGIILRNEFYATEAWQLKQNDNNPILFTSCSGSSPYKGLHVLVRALAILKNKYPKIKLKIAGNIQKRYILNDGYINWLNQEAKALKVSSNIEWLGGINGKEIIEHLLSASVVVVPSFIESYCLSLAESMIVGAPTVISFAGAMPELATHNETALFFPVGDFLACSWQINRLIVDKNLALHISINSRRVSLERHNIKNIISNQNQIYKTVIENSSLNKTD